MAVGWSRRRDDDAEPTTPSPPRKVVGVGFDPANPDALAVALRPMEPVPYTEPDELQDGVVEPTAVFKPGEPLPDWSNVEITMTYYD